MTTSETAAPAIRTDPLSAPPTRLRAAVVTALATVVALIVLGFVLRAVPVDLALSRAVHHLHGSGIAPIAEGFYRALKPLPAAGIMLVATVCVGFGTRRWRTALLFLGTVAVTWGSAEAAKLIVDRPRPGLAHAVAPVIGSVTDASFPSGHVAFTASFALALVVVLWATRWRLVAVAGGVLLVAAMSVSVVVIGVHYAGDVVASVIWVAGVFPAVRAGGAMLIARLETRSVLRRGRIGV